MKDLKFPITWVCILVLLFLLVPTAGAIVENIEIPASIDPLERDRPENIAALKFHDAFIGEAQEARMKGVIAYIDRISTGTGAERLRQIRSDYLAAAASIPAVNTSDEINEMRDEMHVQSHRFEEESRMRLVMYNGTMDQMQESISISLDAFDRALNGSSRPLWLGDAGARIQVFDREAQERNYTLRTLTGLGIDVTPARHLSARIDETRPRLAAAARESRDRGIFIMNTEIKSLVQQYRNAIEDCRARVPAAP